jgi:RNA polymerase sigma-70 factor (ECF subfamily)
MDTESLSLVTTVAIQYEAGVPDRSRVGALVTSHPLRLVKGRAQQQAPGIERHDELGALADAAALGDSRAIRTLVLTIGPHIQRVVRKVLGPLHPDVDDVVQDCAFAIIDALPKRRGESTLLYFACRIAALNAMKVRRRDATLKRFSSRDDKLSVESYACARPAPDEILSSRVTADLVRELLDSLPLEQAEVLMLHCVLGFTLHEMAETSKTSVETLRSRMRLAKVALRNRVLGDPKSVEIIEGSS